MRGSHTLRIFVPLLGTHPDGVAGASCWGSGEPFLGQLPLAAAPGHTHRGTGRTDRHQHSAANVIPGAGTQQGQADGQAAFPARRKDSASRFLQKSQGS